MKKSITIILLCLLGTVASWAEVTTLYERGTTNAWSNDDLTDWVNSGGTLAATINGGLQFSANNLNPGPVYTKEISVTENSIVTMTATFKAGGAPNRDSSYDYIKFGGISFRFYEVNKIAKIDVNGTESQLFTYTDRGAAYDISIEINQATGEVSYVCGDANGSTSSTTEINSVEVGHFRGGREGATYTTVLQKIEVSEEEQTVSTVGYTINYMFSGSNIKQVSGTTVVGEEVNAESMITVDGVKYYAADGATTSMVTSDNADENVLNVELREALKKTVKINAVDADGNVLKEFSTECVEGDAAKNLYYTRAVKYNDQYYTIAAANANGVNYGKSVSYTSSDEDKVYTLNETIVYYAEESGLNVTHSYAAQGQAAERASGGDWQRLYQNSSAYTAALAPGVYKIDISARSQSASSNTLQVMVRQSDGTVGDVIETLTWGNAVCSVQSVEDIEVPNGASINIYNNATDGNGTYYNTNIALDYVIVYRTGDLTESVPVNSAGTSTYVTTEALDFSNVEGLTVLIATEESESTITLAKVTQVPAGAPIIVKGTPNTSYDVPVCNATAYSDNLTNLLSGSTTEEYTSTTTDNIYVLSAENGCFAHLAANVAIPVKKAYLKSAYTTSVNAKSFHFLNEEENATAVSTLSAVENKQAQKLYNAAGQQVGAEYKGLVISSDGKKYMK